MISTEDLTIAMAGSLPCPKGSKLRASLLCLHKSTAGAVRRCTHLWTGPSSARGLLEVKSFLRGRPVSLCTTPQFLTSRHLTDNLVDSHHTGFLP